MATVGGRWGRYGNVIINRRRWGDLENRVSYGDLIRWYVSGR
jgi:hypothetical protein